MKTRVESIRNRIREAAEACGRIPEDIRLVAVTKTVPPEAIRSAAAEGVRVFGESYIQEAREKIEDLADIGAGWHFIGHLQSNKAKYAVKLFDLIHTVDSVKLAAEIDRQAGKIGKVQNILIQIKTGGEASKSGADPAGAAALAREISQFRNIRVGGLMTIPPYDDDPESAAPFFRELRELRDRIRAEKIPGIAMDELSMGMTGDFEIAIREGATLVRIGTAIFGERP